MREKLSLNSDWKFKRASGTLLEPYDLYMNSGGSSRGVPSFTFDDSDWRSVQLPHDFIVEGGFSDDGQGVGTPEDNPVLWHGAHPLGVGWYRKRFSLSEKDRDNRIYLYFDGIFRDSRVYLNQHFLGTHPSGYTGFYFDVTDVVTFGGDNLLVVRADATRPEGWFYEGGGIYRNTWLVKTEAVHVAPWGTCITSKIDFDSDLAVVTVETNVCNDSPGPVTCQLSTALVGPDGVTAISLTREISLAAHTALPVKQEGTLLHPQLWSIDSPNLYQVISKLSIADCEKDRYKTTTGLRTIRFDVDKGFFLNDQLVKIKGVCCHQDVPAVGIASPDALHDYRIKTLQAYGCNAYRTSHHPPTPELLDACDRLGMLVLDENRRLSGTLEGLRDLESFILRDRNHPSVIAWCLGNEEIFIQYRPEAARITRTLVDLAHRLDPTRPTILATTYHDVETHSQAPFHPTPFPCAELDVMGFNYNLEYWLDYHAENPEQPILITEASTDMRTRGCYETRDEKGWIAHTDSRTQARADEQWDLVDSHPFISGIFLWTGFDYRGEPSPTGWPAVNSQYGILDSCGFSKDNAYYYKAAWKTEPLIHLFPHWNWPDRIGLPMQVSCYTNLDAVELFLNGLSLGRKPVIPNRRLDWDNVIYQPGQLEARGYRQDQRLTTAIIETTGAPYAIRLTPALTSPELWVVNAAIIDQAGRIVPTADNEIFFNVTGTGIILGTGNGNPSDHSMEQAPFRRAFNGLCQVMVQPGVDPGGVTLLATSVMIQQTKIPMISE